jgi:hypothetical protein
MADPKQKRKYTRRSPSSGDEIISDTLEARVSAVELQDTPSPSENAATPPAPPMLAQDEIFKMRLYEAEMRAAKAEAETARIRKKWILALLDPKGTVEAEEKRIQKWLDASKEYFKKYELTKAHASMRLGIDLNKCGFDPETGTVVFPDSAKGKK